MTSPIFFETPAALREWLAAHHADTSELTVGLYKTASGKPTLSYQELVDGVLCFGWIDGIRRKYNDDSYTVRITPRKPKSIWSAVNLKRARALEQAGRMHAAGLAALQGRDVTRTNLYSFENKNRKLDAAYEKRFRANKKAWAWFSRQAPSYQRTASWWVISAKQEATREKRLETLMRDSEQGVKIAPLRRATDK